VFSSTEAGVQVIRVPLPSLDRSKISLRLFQFITFQIQAVRYGRSLDYDVMLTHTPSLEVWLPFAALGVWQKVPVVYSVHDVYPEAGVKMGIFTNRLLVSAVDRLEKYCLKNAARIRILSSSFEEPLIQKGVDPSKVKLIYDWVDTDVIQPQPKDNSFAQRYGLCDHFIMLYTGNLGYLQGLQSVLETARLLSDEPDLRFVFVGDGAARDELVETCRRDGLTHVTFIDYQSQERMPEVLASADVSLVSLKTGIAFEALPSKTFSILASGRPLIASLDPGSDAWDLVERSNGGLCVPPESPRKLSEAILKLKQNRALSEEFSSNGRSYVLKNHSPQSAAASFEDLLQQAASEA
jgi:colanic acid biosynthesis glycosyl transferase WcaI